MGSGKNKALQSEPVLIVIVGVVEADGLGEAVAVGVCMGAAVGEGEGVGVIGCITTRIIKLKVTGVIRFNILGP